MGFNLLNRLLIIFFRFMKWHGSYELCEIFVYTSIISTGCLLWHHAIISMHRYIVVVYNQRQNIYCMNMRQKVSITFSLIITRLIPVLVCLPALYRRNLTVYNSVSLLLLKSLCISLDFLPN